MALKKHQHGALGGAIARDAGMLFTADLCASIVITAASCSRYREAELLIMPPIMLISSCVSLFLAQMFVGSVLAFLGKRVELKAIATWTVGLVVAATLALHFITFPAETGHKDLLKQRLQEQSRLWF